MSIVVRFGPGEATTDQYDEVLHRLDESGNWPPDGLDYLFEVYKTFKGETLVRFTSPFVSRLVSG